MTTQSPVLTITRSDGMSISFPGTYRGIAFPAPRRGLEILIQTAVNAARNANATFVGEKVGRDNYKLNNLEWAGISGDAAAYILQLFADFTAYATFVMPDSNQMGTIKIYRGDVTVKPLHMNSDGTIKTVEKLAVNIIDCGEI